jgi:hypothetical protein
VTGERDTVASLVSDVPLVDEHPANEANPRLPTTSFLAIFLRDLSLYIISPYLSSILNDNMRKRKHKKKPAWTYYGLI